MPRLSVLLPVKDGASTILSAVRSTLLAMPRDSELLVIDDGSTDGTAESVSRITDARLRVVRQDRSRGVADSLNVALQQTDSRFVARMDADDITLPWRFRVQLPALHRADHVFGSIVLIDGRSRLVGLADPAPVTVDQAPLHLLLENPFAHPTLVARRASIELAGAYRRTPVEDYDLWLRAAALGQRLHKVRTPVLAYRRHDGQVTTSWNRGAIADPLLGESYAALLPEDLRPSGARLLQAAVFRDPRIADEGDLRALVRHIERGAGALNAGARRRLLRRAGRSRVADR